MDITTASRQSYAAMFGMVERQAQILSYVTVFRILGVMFLLMAPLVLIMRKPSGSGGAAPMH
jgi:hypothetical protein